MTIRMWWMTRGMLVLAVAGLLAGTGCVRQLRFDANLLPLKLQTAVAVDKDGNQILAGTFARQIRIGDVDLTSAGGSDIFVAKISRDGRPVFPPQRFGGPGEDVATGVAVDGDGSIVIAGTFQGEANFGTTPAVARLRPGQRALFVAKLDATGRVLWVREIAFANLPTQVSVAIGPDQNIFVGASSVGTVGKPGASMNLAGESIFLDTLGPDGVSTNNPPKLQAMMVQVVCQHPVCQQGGPLDQQCDWLTVGLICAADPWCCGISWDGQCVAEVLSIARQRCNCSDKCNVGLAFNAGACLCVGQLCSTDSFCCQNRWDSTCVSEVAANCPPDRCP